MLSLFLAAALALPPLTSEVAASQPVLAPVADVASDLRIAANDRLAVAVWQDRRDDNSTLACRIDANGQPLDPTGILVSRKFFRDVFANGSSFEVLAGHRGSYELVTLDSDGNVTTRVPIAAKGDYLGRGGEGAATRLLFALNDFSTPGLIEVAELSGVVHRHDHANVARARLLGAGDAQHFLILRLETSGNAGIPPVVNYVSEIFDRDGNAVSSAPSGLVRPYFDTIALSADGAGGYALVNVSGGAVAVDHLTANGSFATSTVVVQTYAEHPLASGTLPHLQVTPTADGFATAAIVMTSQDKFEAWQSRSGEAARLLGSGNAYWAELAYEPQHDLSVTVSTEFVVQQHGGDKRPMAFASDRQSDPKVAASANGFLVEWSEGLKTFVRRFDAAGRPSGDPQLLLPQNALQWYGEPNVVSDGDTYLVGWNGYGRRMDAHSGEWIDGPFPLIGTPVAALPGVALTRAFGSAGTTVGTMALRGVATPSGQRVIETTQDVQIAAGRGSWIYVFGVHAFCSSCVGPTTVSFSLARPDGTPVEGPHVLSATAADRARVVWDGSRWLLLWPEQGARGTMIPSAVAISADGSVEWLPAVPMYSTTWYASSILPVTHKSEVLLFEATSSASFEEFVWAAGTMTGEWNVATTTNDFGLQAASNGETLLVVGTRNDDANGRVPRVFVQARSGGRTRAARH
jgi:hypothetical protein